MGEVKPVIVGEVGSVAHGLGVPESDHDYHGVYIDPPEVLVGLKPETGAVRKRDKPEGVKSEAGDSEATFYGLRKYASLCAQGNPTVLTLLFTPNLIVPDEIGLQEHRMLFLSKRIAERHMGYAESMYRRLTGDLAPRTNRPELIAKHGYDTKAAFHALRLLMQGYEMLCMGTMTMPMQPHWREYLLSVRKGEVAEAEVLEQITDWKAMIAKGEEQSSLPDHPNYESINRYLIKVHKRHWKKLESKS